MNDERLVEMLGSLGHERMARAADARARQRLEREWADLRDRGPVWLRVLRPAVIVVAFLGVVGFATLRAPGDSPLYGVRVAIEDAAANAYADPQDRLQYLLALYEQRQEEAARLESVGSAASSGARRIEQRTLATLSALLPRAPEETPPAGPSPSAPAVAPSIEPSPSPTPSARPSSTTRPTATAPTVAVATARPTPIPTLRPSPAPTPTKDTTVPVVLNGTVVDATGAPAREVCVSVTAGQCLTRTTTAGVYRLTVGAHLGQTVTVYAWTLDATGKIAFKGTATVVVRGSSTQVPTIALRPY